MLVTKTRFSIQIDVRRRFCLSLFSGEKGFLSRRKTEACDDVMKKRKNRVNTHSFYCWAWSHEGIHSISHRWWMLQMDSKLCIYIYIPFTWYTFLCERFFRLKGTCQCIIKCLVIKRRHKKF